MVVVEVVVVEVVEVVLEVDILVRVIGNSLALPVCFQQSSLASSPALRH